MVQLSISTRNDLYPLVQTAPLFKDFYVFVFDIESMLCRCDVYLCDHFFIRIQLVINHLWFSEMQDMISWDFHKTSDFMHFQTNTDKHILKVQSSHISLEVQGSSKCNWCQWGHVFLERPWMCTGNVHHCIYTVSTENILFLRKSIIKKIWASKQFLQSKQHSNCFLVGAICNSWQLLFYKKSCVEFVVMGMYSGVGFLHLVSCYQVKYTIQ